ncbi:hypothetical protein BDR26DRAFT_465468 [Obelidium mucronatum]|nr:hypothetical protein BDR26DRAFT_465468 [Obelidium mucronatum]
MHITTIQASFTVLLLSRFCHSLPLPSGASLDGGAGNQNNPNSILNLASSIWSQFFRSSGQLESLSSFKTHGYKAKRQANTLKFYDGPVISNVEITPIFYGSFDYPVQISAFYEFLVTSPFMDVLAEYSTPVQKIGYGTLKSAYIEPDPRRNQVLDDSEDLVPYLRNLVIQGVLAPTSNSYYPIYFESGISISQAAKGLSCLDFCGYHGGPFCCNNSAS